MDLSSTGPRVRLVQASPGLLLTTAVSARAFMRVSGLMASCHRPFMLVPPLTVVDPPGRALRLEAIRS